MKVDLVWEEMIDTKSEVDGQSDWKQLNDEDFEKKLAEMAIEDDQRDREWIPERLQRKAQEWKADRKKRFSLIVS